jgi:uncharacterized Zn finger protein (UPF0148 family)
MEKYYEKKAIRSGQKRYCKSCKSPLSRYNTLNICAKCEKNNSTSDRDKIIGMINDAC